MNCISCGKPSIKFEFSPDSLTERIFLCENISCFLEFQQIYKSFYEKSSENIFSSIEKSLKLLYPVKIDKFVKYFGYFEIFSEEIYDQNPKDFLQKDKILEFYMKHLNYFNKNHEKMLIGPITAQKIIENPKNFDQIVKKRIIHENQDFSEIKEAFIIFRGSDKELEFFSFSNENEEQNLKNLKIYKNEIFSNLIQIMISNGIAKKTLSNLASGTNSDIINKGYNLCLKAEEFVKFDNDLMKSDKDLMVKIIELINLV